MPVTAGTTNTRMSQNDAFGTMKSTIVVPVLNQVPRGYKITIYMKDNIPRGNKYLDGNIALHPNVGQGMGGGLAEQKLTLKRQV